MAKNMLYWTVLGSMCYSCTCTCMYYTVLYSTVHTFNLQDGFEGFACEKCKDKTKFGDSCDKSRLILLQYFQNYVQLSLNLFAG